MTETSLLAIFIAGLLAGMAVGPFVVARWRRWRREKGQHRG
jgi:hypothetical protein